jgi:hypothetical protein
VVKTCNALKRCLTLRNGKNVEKKLTFFLTASPPMYWQGWATPDGVVVGASDECVTEGEVSGAMGRRGDFLCQG